MDQHCESSKRPKPQTNLLNLPRDMMIMIFIKLGVFDLLLNAQRVCSSWQAIAKDPQLYRVIQVIKPYDYPRADYVQLVEAVTIEAVNRSRGQLVEFSMGFFCTDRILKTVVHNSPMLRRFRLSCCYQLSEACLIEVFQRLPLLEEVEFLDCLVFMTDVVKAVGQSCSNLKLFRLKSALQTVTKCCEKAVVDNLNPDLHTLDMPGSTVTVAGLKALLERFTQLKYLGIRVVDDVADGKRSTLPLGIFFDRFQ